MHALGASAAGRTWRWAPLCRPQGHRGVDSRHRRRPSAGILDVRQSSLHQRRGGMPQNAALGAGLDSDSLGDCRRGVSLSGCRLDEAAGGRTPVHNSSVARAAHALRCRPARRASRCRARDESTARGASRDAPSSCHSSFLGRGTTDLSFRLRDTPWTADGSHARRGSSGLEVQACH